MFAREAHCFWFWGFFLLFFWGFFGFGFFNVFDPRLVGSGWGTCGGKMLAVPQLESSCSLTFFLCSVLIFYSSKIGSNPEEGIGSCGCDSAP